jgi:hypothetical protein
MRAQAVVLLAAAMLCVAAYGFGHGAAKHEPLNQHSDYLAGVSGCVGAMWAVKLFFRVRHTNKLKQEGALCVQGDGLRDGLMP